MKLKMFGFDGDNANKASHGDDADSQSSLPDNKNFPPWGYGCFFIRSSWSDGGFVADVSLVVDLQVAHGEMITSVFARDLRHVREFQY